MKPTSSEAGASTKTRRFEIVISMAALAAALSLIPAAHGGRGSAATGAPAATTGAMPVAQQNTLVQKYCEVCHDDAYMNGGISFEHFDAAHADPGDAAMMTAKLQTGAIGAAGIPEPDKQTITAWISAMAAESAGANQWIVSRGQNPTTKAPVLKASIVQSSPSSANPDQPDLYRLTVTCRVDARQGEIQLLWSPGAPEQNQEISAAVDGKGPFQFRVEGMEQMGRGGTSGPGAITLFATNEFASNKGSAENSKAPRVSMALPAQTLTLSNLIQNETIVFPFSDLPQSARQALSPCFSSGAVANP